MQRSKTNNKGKGLVFNIQKFSVHDGPGIRTTVFLKGCPLHCLWCCNPESQGFVPDLIARDIHCKKCGACVKSCPRKAITITKETGRQIDRKKCNKCLPCVYSCLYNSLIRCGTYMTVPEVLDQVLQDQPFYKYSGGGVTISGGESLSQSKFAGALLAECKKEGLHTVLETSGYARWKDMKVVLDFVDLILFDIKQLNCDEHQKATGVKNIVILDNLKRASMISNIWLRIPLIAGFNDSGEHIQKIALLGNEIGAKKISLLSYHEGGKSKSEQLGKSYCFPDRKPPDEKHINQLKQIIEKAGLIVSVGN